MINFTKLRCPNCRLTEHLHITLATLCRLADAEPTGDKADGPINCGGCGHSGPVNDFEPKNTPQITPPPHDVHGRIADHPISRIAELLPWNFDAARPRAAA